MRFPTFCIAALVAGCTPASPAIEVRDAWARATAPRQSSAAVYATIVNQGAADSLVSVSSPAGMAMLHGNDNTGGVARMRMLAQLPISTRGEVKLVPGGIHVMLTGLKAPLAAGTHFPLTLRFAASGDRPVDVAVVAAGAR